LGTIKKASYVEKTAADIAKKAIQDAVKAITGNTAGTKTIKAATKIAASNTIAEEKHAYIFFNCDASKAPASMNIRFNNEVYRDYPAGREDLLAKVEAELAAGNIKIADWEAVRKAILEGQPTEASALMEFGCIECLIMS
jgi:hypothetical protein